MKQYREKDQENLKDLNRKYGNYDMEKMLTKELLYGQNIFN